MYSFRKSLCHSRTSTTYSWPNRYRKCKCGFIVSDREALTFKQVFSDRSATCAIAFYNHRMQINMLILNTRPNSKNLFANAPISFKRVFSICLFHTHKVHNLLFGFFFFSCLFGTLLFSNYLRLLKFAVLCAVFLRSIHLGSPTLAFKAFLLNNIVRCMRPIHISVINCNRKFFDTYTLCDAFKQPVQHIR